MTRSPSDATKKRAKREPELDRHGQSELVQCLRELERMGRAYMKYHREKFYPDGATPPTGITPYLDKARALLSALEAQGSGETKEGA